MHLHLDAVGGVAGDMFIAAMLDAFPEHRETMLAAIHAAGLPPEVRCEVIEHRDHALTGLRFRVDDPHDRAHRHAHAHGLQHHHDETPFAQIRDRLRAAPLAPGVRERALHMFTLLAEVEGRIHGMPPEQVGFHELGGWDSIADIVGAAALIEAVGAATWGVSTLPLGAGRVKTAHGMLPVPAPATAALLAGYEFADDGHQGERITPTGAAILRHVRASQQRERTARRLLRTGYGFGTATFPALSNVLRVIAYENVEQASAQDRVAQIAFEVDDQTPEDLAIGLDRLRAHPAVLDVLQAPAFGKKGRMVVQVQVLAQPEAVDDVAAACFAETATLGLRWQVVERQVLPRRQHSAESAGRMLRVKVADRPGAPTAKVESDDLISLTGGREARERARRAAEAAALEKTEAGVPKQDG